MFSYSSFGSILNCLLGTVCYNGYAGRNNVYEVCNRVCASRLRNSSFLAAASSRPVSPRNNTNNEAVSSYRSQTLVKGRDLQ